MKFLHVMTRVADIDKSLKFYQELFDLKLSRTKELADKGATLYFLKDNHSDVEIELTYNHETPDGGYTKGTGFGHFAFETDSMDAFTEKLHAFGLDYTREPFFLSAAGSKIAFVEDPDGNAVEIIEKRK